MRRQRFARNLVSFGTISKDYEGAETVSPAIGGAAQTYHAQRQTRHLPDRTYRQFQDRQTSSFDNRAYSSVQVRKTSLVGIERMLIVEGDEDMRSVGLEPEVVGLPRIPTERRLRVDEIRFASPEVSIGCGRQT